VTQLCLTTYHFPLEGGEWSAARPRLTLPSGKTRYPLYRRLGVPQGRSGRAENFVPTEIRSRTFQPVVSRYTDWATQPISYDVLGSWNEMYSHRLEDRPWNRSKFIMFYLFFSLRKRHFKTHTRTSIAVTLSGMWAIWFDKFVLVCTECSKNTLYKTHLAATEE